MAKKANDLADLVRQKIDNLRPKLLDLSRRNPLIATKLGPRSNSHIRAVDELPDILFYKLNNGQTMRLVPLPAIEDDPRDERTGIFRDALINARLTDDQYLSEMEAVQRDADDYLDRTRQIERALKDRIRASMGMPPRTDKTEVNLINHAKINGITPSYELPKPKEEHTDGRHTDNDIQTLLLPNDLERKLNSVVSKCRTWMQETGMNVLQVAYGFLEWSDNTQSETSFAPLILCEAQIDKRRTPEGVEFLMGGTGDDPETNAVLAEKLRLDFGIELPKLTGASVEEYFAEVAKLSPRNITWRVRRQVAIGVFPSARMAMYHDLDVRQPGFPQVGIVHDLLGGSNSDSASPFADEYEVDKPEIERKVPCLVMDADSSQFSTLVDVADGKNLAVEGPPGTGKSQTIVNAIAAALADGKKVLFVAEKLAALNVVKSRLEAAGLGEFLLPLQAERSTREQVMSSVRERIEAKAGSAVRDFDAKLEDFRRTRKQLGDYLELMNRPFEDTGLTVRDVLGRSIASNPALNGISPEVLEQCRTPQSSLTVSGLALIRQLGTRIADAHREASTAKTIWKPSRLLHPERFTIEEACDLAMRGGGAFADVVLSRATLSDVGVSIDTPNAELERLDAQLGEAQQYVQRHGMRTVLNLLRSGSAENARRFGARCEAYQQKRKELGGLLANRPSADCLEPIRAAAQVWERLKVSSIDLRVLNEQLEDRRKALKTAQTISHVLEPLVERHPQSRAWQLGDIAKAHALLKDAGREAVLSRNPRLAEPDAVILLQRLCVEGRQLFDKKTELVERVSFAVESSVDGLVDCVSVLRVGGIFRFCSPRYHRAKRTFLSISRTETYDRRSAVDTLEALIAFRRRETEFSRQPHVSTIFGVEFRGLDTDFGHFERVASYYRSVDENFGQPDKRGLRMFLRDADPMDLALIPALPLIQVPLTYDQVQERIEKARADIASLEDAITSLRPCVHVFADTSSINPADLRGLVDQVRSYLGEEQALNQSHDIKELLGDAFSGAETAIDALTGLLDWSAGVQPSGQPLSALLSNSKATNARERATRVLAAERLADDLLKRLCTTAKIDARHFTEGRTRAALATYLEEASHDAEGLFIHATFATVLEDVRPTGLMRLVEERQRQGGSLDGLGEQFEAVGVRQLAKAVYAAEGQSLTKFRGSKLDELRKMLAEQDREIIRLSRRQLRTKLCASARPPHGNGIGRKSTWTEMALIENETSKKQRFISVRDLTQRAGRALLELKPCWMMSPLAVAQYVPKGSIHFDLCIIDEASQMPPESAIGALLRCNQTVVVGDTNQLPPSNFFKTVVDDEDADEDETILNESILEMANATFRPVRRLRWHYRSRHSGLIKFSNRLVYDDDLIVFPAATESMSRMGVAFRPVSGRYKAGTNPAEAKAMVEAALEFMRVDPNRSLGLVTLNQKQRDLIGEELEYALANNPQALKYVETWKEKNDGLEEFFVKNLENVQGDERDVIFIGTVYGAEEPGARVMQRFGPINGLAGKRRLNVLFTRAKQKIVTFSSMTAADITAEEHTNPGSYMLKRWLEYSASGVLDGGERTEREPDSEFEVFVINQIRSMGFVPVPQVGVAGYFVDIGVRHPEWPHGFVLGVECDGASYHSAKSARDRDRLRQEVLEGLGWRLHRIWSTDWFNNPQREAERIRAAVLARLEELKKREFEYAAPAKSSAPQPTPTVAVEVLPLFSRGERAPQSRVQESVASVEVDQSRIAIGDTVRVKYLTDDRKTLHITISRAKSDPSRGVIHFETPVAQALLGAEEGDEVEVLVGSYVRPAIVEKIVKGAA